MLKHNLVSVRNRDNHLEQTSLRKKLREDSAVDTRPSSCVWPISDLNANLPKRRFASIPESSWQDLIRTYRRPTVSVFSDRH